MHTQVNRRASVIAALMFLLWGDSTSSQCPEQEAKATNGSSSYGKRAAQQTAVRL